MSSLSDGRHYRELRNKDGIDDTTTDENALAVSSEQRIVHSDDLSFFPNSNEQRKRSQLCNQTCFTCIASNLTFSSLTEKWKEWICRVAGLCCKRNMFSNKCSKCIKCS